jgi:hypothetical protein
MANVKEEQGDSAIEIIDSDDGKMVWVKGLWKGRLSKSKKGNWNQSWHDSTMFRNAITKYLKGGSQSTPPAENDSEIPF